MMRLPLSVALLCALSACAPEFGSALGSSPEKARVDIIRGQQLFQENCAACHGPSAHGGGAATLGLGVPAPSLRRLTATNAGVYPRDHVLSTIDGLGRHKNPFAAMPEFGAGNMGPLVQVEENGISTPIPADLLALSNYLETLQD